MRRIDRAKIIDRILNKLYPRPRPTLKYKTVYQLLVAVILSAQCTDERVNQVTKHLFANRPGPNAILDMGKEALTAYIRPCGLHNAKAKSILAMSRAIVSEYNGQMPEEFEQLVNLPGVGEKTAGVVLAQGYNKPAFPVDTHIHRLANRLDLSRQDEANKVSADLKKLFPKNRWKDLHLQFIFHGRKVCQARQPDCRHCDLLKVCPEGRKRMVGVRS